MKTYSSRFLISVSTLFVLICAMMLFHINPQTATAQTVTAKKTSFEYSGWIPYWRTASGTADVLPHLSQLKEVNPFGYTVKSDGTLYDASGLEGSLSATSTWSTLRAQAKKTGTRIIPTVMWSDTHAIDEILSDPVKRSRHVDEIVSMVYRNNFDGVDIDYEGKLSKNRDDYSAFLKELYKKMGKKWVMCTIEARTPPDSLYTTIPATLEYVNDYKVINKNCDRVRLMTYDQQRADLKLNKAGDPLYAPVADPKWVEKVIQLAVKDIAKNKLVIGVATYGYIYHVTPSADGTQYSMSKVEPFNPRYATDLANELSITPQRNRAGELYFTYVGEEIAAEGGKSQSALKAASPSGTPSALLASVGAAKIAQANGERNSFYLLWWSDSKAIADKIALAKKYGLRGVAVFKFDGGADPALWSVLK